MARAPGRGPRGRRGGRGRSRKDDDAGKHARPIGDQAAAHRGEVAQVMVVVEESGLGVAVLVGERPVLQDQPQQGEGECGYAQDVGPQHRRGEGIPIETELQLIRAVTAGAGGERC